MNWISLIALIMFISFLFSKEGQTWGKHGHAILCRTTAFLLADESPNNEFLRSQSFELGHYCNVPDFHWKKPQTNAIERHEHYVNPEVFQRKLGLKKIDEVWKKFRYSRREFRKKYPQVPISAGNAIWRTLELSENLFNLKKRLKNSKLTRRERQNLQKEWIIVAGVLGHYIGDLSMPLHLTENFDGQASNQRGVHAFYEHEMINNLYLRKGFSLEGHVFEKLRQKNKKAGQSLKKKSNSELILTLSRQSYEDIGTLLKNDHRSKRDLEISIKIHKENIIKHLARGALFYAEILRRSLGWEFDSHRFFKFKPEPPFIPPDEPSEEKEKTR